LNINDIITKFDFDKDITVDKYGNRRDDDNTDYYNEKETFHVSFTIYDKSLAYDRVANKDEVKNKLNAFFNEKIYIEQNPERTRAVQHSTDLPESSTDEQIWNAIVNKNVVMLNQLATSADAQGIAINYTDPEGRPPIYFAIKLKESSVLKELLKHKCFDVNQQNNRGDTPLHLAIYYRDIEKLKLLVEKPEIIIDGKAFSLNEEFNKENPEFDEINEMLTNKIITSSPASTTRRYTKEDL
jgi:ankyrin repeat protein